MYNFCFVILHFNAMEDTVECIESILNNIDYQNKSIVVVDNNSPNKSGLLLFDKYAANDKVHVILNTENVGFANGNNIGYDYASNQLAADFVAAINNDTVIYQKDFALNIIELFKKEHFHLMGPDIVSKNGQHQNPYKEKSESLEEVNYFLDNYKKLLLNNLIRIRLRSFIIKYFNFRLLKLKRKSKPKTSEFDHLKVYKNIVLHGSAIIFSPLYLEKEKFAFHPDTFMFMEEDILYFLSVKKGYKSIYSPITSIYHKEDVSTNSLLKSDYKKIKFKFEHVRKSRLVLKKLLEEK